MNLRSQVSRLFGAFKASEADSSSQLPLQSQDGVNPSTPQNKQRGAKSTDMLPSDAFMAVPDEVLVQIVTKLNSTSDLCSLASVAKRWQSLVEVKKSIFKLLSIIFLENRIFMLFFLFHLLCRGAKITGGLFSSKLSVPECMRRSPSTEPQSWLHPGRSCFSLVLWLK
jgi:hypothetical protein